MKYDIVLSLTWSDLLCALQGMNIKLFDGSDLVETDAAGRNVCDLAVFQRAAKVATSDRHTKCSDLTQQTTTIHSSNVLM
jgi:hypothetical protein